MGNDMLGTVLLPRLCQARHSLQVSTIGLIMFNLASSRPTALRMVLIRPSLARHHRRWSFLSSLCITEGTNDRRFLKLTAISNLVQSGEVSWPAAASRYVVLSLWTKSGPLLRLTITSPEDPGMLPWSSSGS